MKPSQSQIDEIIEIAEANPTQEVCGYVLGDRLIQCQNLADDPKEEFKLSAPDEASCVWHSHVNGTIDFSVADIKASKWESHPYFLYCVGTGRTQYFDPNYTAPYLGREFHWSWQNCYTLFQDYYRKELQIELPDFYLRSPDSYRYESVGYIEELPRHGFRQLSEDETIARNDVILMYMGTAIANHIAIMQDPDKGIILHHLVDRLSGLSTFRRRKDVHSVWRHFKSDLSNRLTPVAKATLVEDGGKYTCLDADGNSIDVINVTYFSPGVDR